MNPTEELRAKLDERGVEYRIDDAKTARSTEWEFGEHSSAMFTEYDDGECVFVASGHTWTPEQAIAATVGERNPDGLPIGLTVSNDGNLLNWVGENYVRQDAATVGAGTLTAEQVRECSKGVYFEGYSDGATHRVNGIEETDWQAIADKLNATLGAGTCHYVPDETGFTWWDENDVEHYEEHSASDECCSASCDKCGNQMMAGDDGWFDGWDEITEWWEEDGSYHKGYVLEPRFKHCPNCGRKVTE